MNLYFEIKGNGFPILCLHGHPGNARSLSVFTDHLSQRFQTISPDLRGYGKSKALGSFQMRDHLLDLEELLDKLKIKRCLLLGWSLGGILALELALKNPERFTGLVLIASAARPFGSHPPVNGFELLATAVAGIVNWIVPGWEWNIELLGKRSLFRYLLQQQTPQAYQYLAAYAVEAYLQTSSAANAALNQALKGGYNRLDDLGKIEFPCLVLAGAEDRHITADSSKETAQKIKHCQWQCYQHTAHLFPWEIPTRVLKDLDSWLENHPQVVSITPYCP